MAAYLLFVETTGPESGHNLCDRLGISQIERGECHLTWVPSETGPGGKPGMLGFWLDHQRAGQPQFTPDRQQWTAVPVGEGQLVWYVGTRCDEPLTPRDILRLKPHPRSLAVRLEDGQEWAVPVARWLPHVWGQDALGKMTRTPAHAYSEFCAEAEKVFQQLLGFASERSTPGGVETGEQGSGDLQIECQWSFVCQALSLNYRLAPEIISALGLVGDASGPQVVCATVELSLINDVVNEKKNSESADTPAGSST